MCVIQRFRGCRHWGCFLCVLCVWLWGVICGGCGWVVLCLWGCICFYSSLCFQHVSPRLLCTACGLECSERLRVRVLIACATYTRMHTHPNQLFMHTRTHTHSHKSTAHSLAGSMTRPTAVSFCSNSPGSRWQPSKMRGLPSFMACSWNTLDHVCVRVCEATGHANTQSGIQRHTHTDTHS